MHSKNVDFVFIIILNDYYDRKQKNYLYCLLKHSIFFLFKTTWYFLFEYSQKENKMHTMKAISMKLLIL